VPHIALRRQLSFTNPTVRDYLQNKHNKISLFSITQISALAPFPIMSFHPSSVVYPMNGTMATPGIPQREPPPYGLVFTAHNHISIAASTLTVLTTILDTTTWDKWNTFNRSARIYHRPDPVPPSESPQLTSLFANPDFLVPGCKYTETVHASGTDLSHPAPEKGKQLNNLEVTSIESFQEKDGKKSYRIVWVVLDWSPWLLQSRRTLHFVERDGGTEYDAWTEMGGLLAWVLRLTGSGLFERRFQEATEGLKDYLEGRRGEDGVAEN